MSALVALVVAILALAPASSSALDEADRLWLVGERAFADRLFPVARRALERFVADYRADRRLPEAVLLLGRTRLALDDPEGALEAFWRAQSFLPPPGRPLESRFWEGEAQFRLKRFVQARAAYDDILKLDAASPLAPDALYGRAWTEIEMGQLEPAVRDFDDFLATWPDHPRASTAAFQLARTLVELKRSVEALPVLTTYQAKYPRSRFAADVQFLLGWARVDTGDARSGVADLRAFVAAHPGHPQVGAARRLLTRTLATHGTADEMLQSYAALMAETPPTAEGLYDAAVIAGRLGRAADHDAAWRRLHQEFPAHPLTRRVALEVAIELFKQKSWKDAAELGRLAAESDEERVKSEAWLLVGESELKLRRFAPAVKAFEAVGAVPEIDAVVRYRALAGLGLAREEMQQWRPALAAYESVASKSPDATLREWARQRVAAIKDRLKPAPSSKKTENPS